LYPTTPGVVLAVQDRITSCVPVPERLSVCELPPALSAMLSEAVSVPAMEGVNITTIVQLSPAPSELPHVLVCSKSLELVPVIVRLVMFRVALPVLLRVTPGDVLVTSMGWLPKPKLVVERLTMGPPTEKYSGLEAPPPGAGFVTTTA
jgi:hypothetical protein